jgi:SSS family transporter
MFCGLSVWFLFTACSSSDSKISQGTLEFDDLTTVNLQSIPLVNVSNANVKVLGVIEKILIYQNLLDNSIGYYWGTAHEDQMVFNLNMATLKCFPLQNSLLLTDSINSRAVLLTAGKTDLQAIVLPQLPAELNFLKICFVEQKDVLYLGTWFQGTLDIYHLPGKEIENNKWEILTSLEMATGNDFLITFQSNGIDECLYVFSKDNGVYEYNMRLKHWNNKYSAPLAFDNACSASGKGAAHIILPDINGSTIHVYNTITNAFSVLESTPGDGSLKLVQVSGNDVNTVYYHTSSNSFEHSLLTIEKIKNGFSATDITVIVLYFGVLVLIGFYFSKRQKSSDDYFKGGQRIPWWAAGLSLFGTALSAITFMAIPAKAYATDWSYMLFNGGILLVAPIIMFVFIPFYRKLNITTAYQYLEVRFNALIRVICSLAFIVFQVGRMGVILLLPAIAINVVTGFNIFLCIALMGVFSIIYTRMGGIEAVVWTDALQVVILLGGALFAIFHMVGQIPGGWSETISIAYNNGKLNMGSAVFDLKNSTMWTVLIATFFTNLTTYGTDQSMVQRYLTTSSQKAARKSLMTNALLTIPATVIFFMIGTVLFVYYKTNPSHATATLDSTDAIFPWYIYTKLPAGMVGLLIAGIFAAAMSTLSGSMNSAATAYVVDIRPKLFKNKPPADLNVAKRATLIIGGISLCFAFFMATWNINSLWDEFNKLLGLILGNMGGLFLLGMITKRANAPGALIGMLVSVIIQLIVAYYTPVYLLLYTTVGFISCFSVGYLASLFFKQKKILYD